MSTHVFSQTHPLFIGVLETDTWDYPWHRHTHFELIYILQGRGVHHINEQHFDYAAGDLFLFNTHDAHSFTIAERTRFCVVQMNLGFLLQANETFQVLRPLLEQPSQLFERAAFDEATAVYIEAQMQFCLREFSRQEFLFDKAIQASLLNVLLLLTRDRLRHWAQQPTASLLPSALVPSIIHYIHDHLKNPGALSIKSLAGRFHLSTTYMGQFFRRNTGKSLKHFINESRVQALQQELQFTDKTVSQLAFEYGFSDESHLVKIFKSAAGTTPASYRHQVLGEGAPVTS
jgi:AraC family L-rhamnose operon regulatory protein RhaS